jgi:hypothetical protein
MKHESASDAQRSDLAKKRGIIQYTSLSLCSKLLASQHLNASIVIDIMISTTTI